MKIGRVSENVYKRSILQQIKTKREEVLIGAGPGEDCAIFSFNGAAVADKSDKIAIISCMRESAIQVDTEEKESSCMSAALEAIPMSYLLIDCANELAAHGAEAVAISLSILIPAEESEEVLKTAMAEAEACCAGLGIQIAQARSRVTEAAQVPFATVTAYGKYAADAEQAASHTVKAAKPGHDIVVSKWIGLEGTAILAARYRESLLEHFPAWLAEEAAAFDKYLSIAPEAAVAMKSGVCALHNVSEGGILAALWELAEGAGVGLTIDLKKLPIRQETVEICNYCNRNPYELLSGGCLLMTGEDGAGLEAALKAAGIPAAVVGRITDSNDRLILNEDEVRYLDRPRTDSIYEKGEKS